MRHLSLKTKFILFYVAFTLLGFLGISTLSSQLMTENAVKEKAAAFYREGIYMSQQYVGDYFETPQNQQTLTSVRSSLNSLKLYLNARIWLISTEGEIIMDSETGDASKEQQIISDFSSVLPGGSYYTTGNFFGMFEEDMLSALIPVSHNYHVRGYIAVHTPMSVITQEKEGYLLGLYMALILLMVLGVLFGVFLWLLIGRPLRKLNLAADEYAAGNFGYPLDIDREDEIGTLSRTMKFMADTLQDNDDDQRKMISNISHDFRSPLTSIKGYIEAMLDGTISQEMQPKYLNIVLRETERLTKLTSGLLSLNAMDPKQNRLDKTNFDINAVIKNTAASFEGTCTARHITIDLLFSDWYSYVCADMGKIQQVLYNLIDNAIKFSPADSTITIETTTKYEKIFVSVRDTGIGIPKDSLKKIWERFYKTDQSRGKDKKGTGLGLSIVKEIIQMHGENINVVSTEGVGTEFIFSLSRSSE
jgi:signal transduction histidine kinase